MLSLPTSQLVPRFGNELAVRLGQVGLIRLLICMDEAEQPHLPSGAVQNALELEADWRALACDGRKEPCCTGSQRRANLALWRGMLY
jgi:hypothetical protein